MTAAVLDTNALVSGFTHREGPSGRLLRLWILDGFDLIISDVIFEETARTFQKPYFQARLGLKRIAADLALLQSRAIVVPITVSVQGVAAHPEDDLILATAVSAGAEYLVTGDAKLQALRAYEAVTILSPRAFLQVISEEQG